MGRQSLGDVMQINSAGFGIRMEVPSSQGVER